jgi:hypothetical protein
MAEIFQHRDRIGQHKPIVVDGEDNQPFLIATLRWRV